MQIRTALERQARAARAAVEAARGGAAMSCAANHQAGNQLIRWYRAALFHQRSAMWSNDERYQALTVLRKNIDSALRMINLR